MFDFFIVSSIQNAQVFYWWCVTLLKENDIYKMLKEKFCMPLNIWLHCCFTSQAAQIENRGETHYWKKRVFNYKVSKKIRFVIYMFQLKFYLSHTQYIMNKFMWMQIMLLM